LGSEGEERPVAYVVVRIVCELGQGSDRIRVLCEAAQRTGYCVPNIFAAMSGVWDEQWDRPDLAQMAKTEEFGAQGLLIGLLFDHPCEDFKGFGDEDWIGRFSGLLLLGSLWGS